MSPQQQVSSDPHLHHGTRARVRPLRAVNPDARSAAGQRPWWTFRWPLLTALAWAVLLVTAAAWWLLYQPAWHDGGHPAPSTATDQPQPRSNRSTAAYVLPASRDTGNRGDELNRLRAY